MSYETVAEGHNWDDLRRALSYVSHGEQIVAELAFRQDLTSEELTRLQRQSEEWIPGAMSYKQVAPAVLRVTLWGPDRHPGPGGNESVGIIWFVPLLAIGGILTGLAGWRIMTATPSSILRIAVPLVLVAAGAWLLYKKLL